MPPGRPAREAIAGLETRRRRTLTDRRGRRARAARPHRAQGAPASDIGKTSRDRRAIRLRRSGLPPRRSVTPHRAVPGAATAAAHRAVIVAAEARPAIAAEAARAVLAAAIAPALHTVGAAVDGAATGSA